jgi:hypothetical protein
VYPADLTLSPDGTDDRLELFFSQSLTASSSIATERVVTTTGSRRFIKRETKSCELDSYYSVPNNVLVHWSQEQVDGTLADSTTVLNALLNGVAEVNADEDSRQSILFSGFGEGREGAKHRRCIDASAAGG